MAIRQIFVSDLSNVEGTDASPVITVTLPVVADDGSLSFREVDLTAEEIKAYTTQVQRHTRKYVEVSRETDLMLTSPEQVKTSKSTNGRDRDLTVVRKWLKAQVKDDGTARFPDLKDSGRIPSDLMDVYNAAHGPSNVPSTGTQNAGNAGNAESGTETPDNGDSDASDDVKVDSDSPESTNESADGKESVNA